MHLFQTKEDETLHFEEYVSKFGEARFADMAPKVQSREFSVSADPNEWKYVERLLPKTLIPNITPKENFASGFQLPKISPDEAIEKYGYFVGRPVSQMLPVYIQIDSSEKWDKFGNQELSEEVYTRMNKCEGNMYQLRDDIDQFLKDKYKQEFISQVSELQQRLLYKGDFEDEFKEFLLSKGF